MQPKGVTEAPSVLFDRAIELVWGWVLPGNAKLVWLRLWADRDADGMVRFKPAAIAPLCGLDVRTVRRAIEDLEAVDLTRVHDPPKTARKVWKGFWRLQLVDPAELEKARRRDCDAQRELLRREVDEALADEARGEEVEDSLAQDCPQLPPSETFGKARAKTPLPSEPSVPLEPLEPSVPSEGARLIGAQIVERAARHAARRPLDDEWRRSRETLAQEIRRRVGRRGDKDAGLRMTPALRVADAVLGGRLDPAELEELLRWLEAGRNTLRLEPWKCFIGAARKAFARCGLAWPEKEE